jgi:adenine-specific DNA-methyltransferase
MAKLEQLLRGIQDPELRSQLETEVAALKDRTRFGLVYERHLPETVIVGDTNPLNVGDHVRPKVKADEDEDYRVLALNSANARIVSLKTDEESDLAVKDLLVVKRFGDPAYVALEPLDAIRRSRERPYHTVINGENFHVLQALLLVYEHQVDCIYIDPPYNTGARDWKYNNDYVDDNDTYRHSKWLSFMEKRLNLARRLLKRNGVLIVTIDENEVHHLGVLLEESFPEARRQLVSILINPSGASGEGLSRVEEYAFFCYLNEASPVPTHDDMLLGEVDAEAETEAETVGGQALTWESLLRRGNAWYRASRPNLCYPVLLNEDCTRIMRAGEPFSGEDESKRPEVIDGCKVAWPVRRDGKLGIWRVEGARLNWLAERGFAFVGGRDDKRGTWALKYLMSGTVDAIKDGAIELTGHGESGQVLGRLSSRRGKTAKTMWKRGRHNAGGSGGTQLLNALLGERNIFSFPKSVYAVRDCLEVAIGNRKDALILDFFAGSGTTLHATCLLNAKDEGKRRCILVTNNEVSVETKRKLAKDGYYRGQSE